MPKTMPAGLMEFLGLKNKRARSYSTLQILINDGDILRQYRFATARGQQWKPPAPYEFVIENDECRITVVEVVRNDVPGVKGPMLVRAMLVKYRVPTSDLAEDRGTAMILGVAPEDAMLIDATRYSGARWAESPNLRYAKIEFYAGDHLVASRDIWTLKDPYNVKGRRIYERARALYEQKKAGR